jgi:hypothetical protein
MFKLCILPRHRIRATGQARAIAVDIFMVKPGDPAG